MNFIPTVALSTFFLASHVLADAWPQLRGPNGSGIAEGSYALPDRIGPGQNQRWVVNVPDGVSSPVVHGDQVYLTGVRDESEFVTIALRTSDGSVAWESKVPVTAVEKTDKRPRGRLATPTPATDGTIVVSFFGSCGLVAHDARTGKQRWIHPMGPFNNTRGAAASPIIDNGRVYMLQDHEEGSFCAAWDLTTGKELWRSDRMLFSRSYMTPVIWRGKSHRPWLVLAGSGVVSFYDLESGQPEWFAQGTAGVPNNAVPVVADEHLIVAASNPGPKRSFQLKYPQLVEALDRDEDGRIQTAEIPAGFFASLFALVDKEGDGNLSAEEYDVIQERLGTATNGMIGITPDGKGFDRSATNVSWHMSRSTPRISAPLYTKGHVYTVRDAGFFQAVNAKTGEPVKTGRLPGSGKYFSSPVLGDGKIYVADDRGTLTIIRPGADWEVISSASFDEIIYATPALSAGRIFVRTQTRLYRFGLDR